MGRTLLWLALAGPMWAARAGADPVVVHDRLDGESRRLTLVVPAARGCIPATELVVPAPFIVTPHGRCAITIVGPSSTPVVIAAAGTEHVVDPLTTTPPPTPAAGSGPALSLDIVPRDSVPVGDTVSAAYLVARRGGQPTSDIDLRVTIDGASPRALRWIARGVAEIDVAVTAWRPAIELTVYREGTTAHASVPVDPGPPLDVMLDVPTIVSGQPFILAPEIQTIHAVPIDRERVRVDLDRCTRDADARFRCPPGPVVATIELRLPSGQWAPIDERTFDVRAPVIAPRTAEPARTIGVDLALRAGTSLDSWSTGLRVEGRRAQTADLTLVASAGWRYARDGLVGADPVAGDVVRSEHEVGVAAGASWSPWTAPLFLRATGGVALVGASLGGVGVARAGARGALELAGGVARDRLSASLGLRVIRDAVVAGWRGDAVEAFMEVSYAVVE